MKTISRRQFLFVSGLLSAAYPLSLAAVTFSGNRMGENYKFPITIAVLKAACLSEMTAHQHYEGYSKKAAEERYPNIAYLFSALSVSEKIHAENYQRILVSLGAGFEKLGVEIFMSETRANIAKAAEKELEKIHKIYPDFLAKLKKESHDHAVLNCMYSWKSHRQHEEKINEIRKYCNMFFGSVAKNIEKMKLDFYVCEICGSTVDTSPKTACDICNYPISHYQKVKRPI